MLADVRVRAFDLATFGGHHGQACWFKLAMGLYPGNQAAQRDALIKDLGLQFPADQAEWDWLEASYQRAVDPFFWVEALGHLAAYNELAARNPETTQSNSDAKDWMRAAEVKSYNITG